METNHRVLSASLLTLEFLTDVGPLIVRDILEAWKMVFVLSFTIIDQYSPAFDLRERVHIRRLEVVLLFHVLHDLSDCLVLSD